MTTVNVLHSYESDAHLKFLHLSIDLLIAVYLPPEPVQCWGTLRYTLIPYIQWDSGHSSMQVFTFVFDCVSF